MKKFLVLIACLLLAVFATGSVVADDTSVNAGTDSTHVIYNVNSIYTLIIPSTFHIGSNDEYSFPIDLMLSGSKLGPAQTLNITVSSSQYDEGKYDGNHGTGLWCLKQDEYNLYYHIHNDNGGKIKNESSCFKVTGTDIFNNISAGKVRITEMLHVSLNETVNVAGSFTDTLLFTIDIE